MNSFIHPEHQDKGNPIWFEKFPTRLEYVANFPHAFRVDKCLLQSESTS